MLFNTAPHPTELPGLMTQILDCGMIDSSLALQVELGHWHDETMTIRALVLEHSDRGFGTGVHLYRAKSSRTVGEVAVHDDRISYLHSGRDVDNHTEGSKRSVEMIEQIRPLHWLGKLHRGLLDRQALREPPVRHFETSNEAIDNVDDRGRIQRGESRRELRLRRGLSGRFRCHDPQRTEVEVRDGAVSPNFGRCIWEPDCGSELSGNPASFIVAELSGPVRAEGRSHPKNLPLGDVALAGQAQNDAIALTH